MFFVLLFFESCLFVCFSFSFSVSGSLYLLHLVCQTVYILSACQFVCLFQYCCFRQPVCLILLIFSVSLSLPHLVSQSLPFHICQSVYPFFIFCQSVCLCLLCLSACLSFPAFVRQFVCHFYLLFVS